jgi:hypothetical protein
VDGDDWLAHDGVLEKLNQVYSSQRVWMTYGSYDRYPDSSRKGCCAEIPKAIVKANAFRECKWLSSLLRTFYAGLFKRIAQEDLLYEGNFFQMTWDLSFMFPMLEMCGDRFMYIPDILYIYNTTNPINDFKVDKQLQLKLEFFIRRKNKYQKLSEAMQYPWQ